MERLTSTSISLPSSVKIIGKSLFSGSSSFTSIDLSKCSFTSIPDYTFSRCSSLTSVLLPSSITSIGDNAFDFCSSLQTIDLPSSITAMGKNTFSDCASLTEISLWGVFLLNAKLISEA
jgi:hypothetical protein